MSREKYVCLICTYDTSFTSNVERGVQMSVRAAEKLSRLSLISNNAISLLIFVRFFTIPFHFTLIHVMYKLERCNCYNRTRPGGEFQSDIAPSFKNPSLFSPLFPDFHVKRLEPNLSISSLSVLMNCLNQLHKHSFLKPLLHEDFNEP